MYATTLYRGIPKNYSKNEKNLTNYVYIYRYSLYMYTHTHTHKVGGSLQRVCNSKNKQENTQTHTHFGNNQDVPQ